MNKSISRKKLKVFIPLICFLLLVLIVVILCLKKPKNIMVTTCLTPYNILSDIKTKDTLVLKLYLNQEDSYFSDLNQITSSFIEGKNSSYQVSVTSISKQSDQATLKNQEFYLYYYVISFNYSFLSDYQDEIDEAKLVLDFSNDTHAEIKIGSLSIYKYDKTVTNEVSDIALTQAKAITTYTDKTTLLNGFYGITIGLRNFNETNPVTIQKVILLDGTIKKQNSMVETDDFVTDMSEVYPYYPAYSEENNEITIPHGEARLIAIPIVNDHNNDLNSGSFGLKVIYSVLEEGELKEKTCYCNKFTFYDETVSINENQLTFYEYAAQ